jgi:putative spermidine/putrescine transport system substrate-binding protein
VAQLGVVVMACVLVGACGGNAPPPPCSGVKTAAAAAACAGIAGMYKAAKAEGQLNVIALPRNWVNYGAIIDAFQAKYPGINVNSTTPNAVSQEEIDAINKGGAGAPDVVDLALKVAVTNASLFAPYKVATWDEIPPALKSATGVWVSSYGGFMSVGYDSAKVPGGTIESLADLLGPGFKGKVTLPGDPTQSNQALNGVILASIASGGSVDEVNKGVDFFHRLKVAGNFAPGTGTSASVKSGQTSVLIEWDYVSANHIKDVPGWRIFAPSNANVGGYYTQAINKAARHPAAARLWEEFLFSDAGQSLWLKGGLHPVRQSALVNSGQVDAFTLAALLQVKGKVWFPSAEQQAAASVYLTSNWSKAIA